MTVFATDRLIGAALCAALGLMTPLGAGAAEPVQVRIDNFTFNPPIVTVAKGAAVTWLNADDIPHKIVGNDRPWKSPVLDTDERFSLTFAEPGTYPYFCSLHPHMTGTVVVTLFEALPDAVEHHGGTADR